MALYSAVSGVLHSVKASRWIPLGPQSVHRGRHSGRVRTVQASRSPGAARAVCFVCGFVWDVQGHAVGLHAIGPCSPEV